MKEIFINGRFLAQSVTGIQRFGIEILKAIDTYLCTDQFLEKKLSVTLLIPSNVTSVPQLDFIVARKIGGLIGHAWEQFELPVAVRENMLVSLCQIGPLASRRQVVVMHDASVFAIPESFSLAFRTWYQFAMPLLGRRVLKVITVSEFSRSELARYCGINERKIDIVYESGQHILRAKADYTVLERNNLKDRPFVLAVSSINPNKNFQGIAHAVDRINCINRNGFDIVVAGGRNTRVFQSTANALSGVRFIGYVADQELRALYERASVFVYPSFYEGFGLPPLEAMTVGCPVIVSKRASLPEVCGSAALYCNPDDPDDIAENILRVVSNRSLQESLRHAGYERAKLFMWEKCASTLWDSVLEAAGLVQSATARGSSELSGSREEI